MSLGGLFGDDCAFEQESADCRMELGGVALRVRQLAFHGANANKVWPGSFQLADFLRQQDAWVRRGGVVLELGAATGALSVSLALSVSGLQLVTSDIDDGGEVQANIAHNCSANGVDVFPHIAHTWGQPWPHEVLPRKSIRTIIASDILLYVR